jgi:hypothetical protein
MSRISWKFVCLAFLAEFIADNVVDNVLLLVLANGTLSPDLDQEAMKKAIDAIVSSSAFLLAKLVLGTATTIGGGYLAARLAKTLPYYNGLGIGLVGLVFSIIFWSNPIWFGVFGLLMVVPASIYGAHLAKRQMATPDPPK